MTTIAGTGVGSYSGDGGPAVLANVYWPQGITVDHLGNIYFFDGHNACIREITAGNKYIQTVAGIADMSGFQECVGEDGLPALSTHLYPFERSIVAGNNNDIYMLQHVSKFNNNFIYKLSVADHTMHIICGKLQGYGGDGGRAAEAAVYYPGSLTCDADGNLYFADQLGAVIRKISVADGKITTIAGNGVRGYSGDGSLAKSAAINVGSIAIDNDGDIIFGNITNVSNAYVGAIRKIDSKTGVIATIAGNGKYGYSGDDVDAKDASFTSIFSIAINKKGDIYTAENTEGNHRVRKITKATGKITSVAGNYSPIFWSDGNYPKLRSMGPISIAIDQDDNIIVSDYNNNRIRKITF